MNFPAEQPFVQFAYWLVNTAGLGGVAVGLVAGISTFAYSLTLRWIAKGARADEVEAFAYPTPALHSEHES